MYKLRAFAAVVVVSCAWPIGVRAVCTVNIVDNGPITGLIKNVGQQVQLSANITGGFTSVAWDVEGEVIDDYDEREPGPFSLTDHAEVNVPPLTASFAGTSISFYWRELGETPQARNVTVNVSDGGPGCTDTVTFTTERNLGNKDRQPEDFYMTNHNGRVRLEHQFWHMANRDRLSNGATNRNFDGAEFLCFHRRFISRYDDYRTTFGYPTVAPYDPSTPIPLTDGSGYTLDHAARVPLPLPTPRPTWFTILGAVPSLPPSDVRACLVNGTYQKLADFPSLDQLGCALVSPYHNNVHGNIGPTDNSGNLLGDMGSPVLAPQDPIFWRWHAFLSQIAFTEWLGSLDPDKQAMAACKLPPPLYGACDQASLTYEYDADIPDKYQTYTGKPPKVPANYLYVNGKPATDVSYQSGGTYSTYTYSGYLDQPTGPVTVTIKDNKYTYDSGGGKGTYYVRGDTYTYDNFDCPGGCLDSDGDGVYDAPCWPNPGYDNCPYDYNPDQYDTDAFYTSHDSYGDACQLWTCGNGVQEPGEQCDDGNGASGDGCRSDCQSDESCPNGQVDIGEICDDGNFDDNDGCKNDCTGNGCGDGYPDYSSYYSDTYYFGQPYYGSQPCDDGNLTYGDGCSGDCCPETGYSDRYNTVVGFDCHLRVIDQTLRYSRYDLKIIRKFQAQQRKIRQKFEGKIRYDEYDEPCAAAVKLAPKTKKLALLAEKYTALGKIPSGPGSKLIARAQAYRDYAQSVALIHRTGGGACNP